MDKRKISIITVTYNRRELLLRCMDSISKQEYDGPIEHIIVGDGCPVLLSYESTIRSFYESAGTKINVLINHQERNLETYLWARVASHKNLAASLSSGSCIVNLDDDNTIAPNHLSSLEKTLSQGFDAVHCWRYLFFRDGRPYLRNEYPWLIGQDVLRAGLLFKIQSDAGVFVPGQNVIRDTLNLEYQGDTYCTVDANEWILKKELFDTGELRFTDDYSYTDILYGHCEDYLFGSRIKALGLKVGCTRLPTLNYFLAGTSQAPENE